MCNVILSYVRAAIVAVEKH